MTAHRITTVSVNGGPPEPIETAAARALHAFQARAEKAEKDLQHVLDVGRQEYAEAYAAPIRERAEKAERERDEEHALRCDLERRFDHWLAGADDVRARARGARQTLEVNGYHAAAEAVTNLLVLLDTVDAQRIHEAELAREAIAHVRALLPPPDDIEIPADAAARAWLDERTKV